MIQFTITDVLGETRVINGMWSVDNGADVNAYNCPFCASAVTALQCENPACSASKWASVESATRDKERRERMAREQAERERNHRLAMERIHEDNDRRIREYQDWTMKVRAANGCLACSNQHHGKIRKHRLECPKQAA